MIFLNLGPNTKEQLSKVVGVDPEQTQFFLNKLLADKKIKEEGGKYSLTKNG